MGHIPCWTKKLLFLTHQQCQMKVMPRNGVKETLLYVFMWTNVKFTFKSDLHSFNTKK